MRLSLLVSALALASPAAAVTTSFDKSMLDCFDLGGGDEICGLDYPMLQADLAPPVTRSWTTISTDGIMLTASGEFAARYHWDFYALDGSLFFGNNSYGEFGSFNSSTGQTSGFISDLVVTPTSVSFIANVPPNTDRCANLYAAYGTVGYVCTEVFQGVETFSASLGFRNPPESFVVTVERELMSGPGGEAPVPEPSSWALLIAGFGLIGGVLRRRRVATA